MYRLLIVDDEDIITDGLYEVFSHLKPGQLDVCKAYSAKEALDWMSRTRIDIILTDIAMPGMNGLELSEEIQRYWPRCKVIFLTGYQEFEFVYRAIQQLNVRYVLKAEGYGKVIDAVQSVISEIEQDYSLNQLLEQSQEHLLSIRSMEQNNYLRYVLQESDVLCEREEAWHDDFHKLDIPLDPEYPVVLALGHISYRVGMTYAEKSSIVLSVKMLGSSFFMEKTRSMCIVDKHDELIWFVQPSPEVSGNPDGHFMKYVEGTLELFQEACITSLGQSIGLTMSGFACEWKMVTHQYERLRQLQQLKMGNGDLIFVRDREHGSLLEGRQGRECFADGREVEVLKTHLESGRMKEFLTELDKVSSKMLHMDGNGNVQLVVETYYTIALMLYSCIARLGLHIHIDDYGRLLRLDEHTSIREGFAYLEQTGKRIFRFKQTEEQGRSALMVDRICQYIEQHLGEDLSLVRLSEIHHFNPSYLSRFFKQAKGINLSEFIDSCRVKKAKELLRENDLKVREVALSVGYEAAHSFTRFFKKMTGLTPQEYRDSLLLG
ncbi:DNA-binding response regulator [Paenibacillus sp. CAA11]|uniref:response regulator transcription factor n=1 Tax=Paenibacillus sp. CAA11 TaxID=1532905 RepID=UPI000D383966|nr:response regulator [Paenibacillus sp. CAA11]AWB44675.1 DNA-binding response regulator [Paenibacillus sp. CAA11]